MHAHLHWKLTILWTGTVLLWIAVLANELRPKWPTTYDPILLALIIPWLASSAIHAYLGKRENAFAVSLFLGSCVVAASMILIPQLISLVGWLLV